MVETGLEILKKPKSTKVKRTYGTFKKKGLKSKKNNGRNPERKIPFTPNTGLADNLMLVFLGFMSGVKTVHQEFITSKIYAMQILEILENQNTV